MRGLPYEHQLGAAGSDDRRTPINIRMPLDTRFVSRALTMALKRELDELIDDFVKRHARRFPHFGKAGNVRESGQRVDFVDEQLAVFFQKEIHA